MPRTAKPSPSKPTYIVGIGASAGGLQAIHDLFDNLPSTSGFAFVVVQHLSPDYKSLMAELLAKHTEMPVQEAQDNMQVEANHVYAIPSKKLMTLREGRLQLDEKVKGLLPNTAIDTFFESLAEDQGEKAVAIVLSGTGSDGTRGIEAIKNKGGLVAVQEPSTAAFDGMPNSANATGLADWVLPPAQIGKELIEYLQNGCEEPAQALNLREEEMLHDVLEHIRHNLGYDFTHYKKPTLFRRLSKRMGELGIKKVEDYRERLEVDPQELRALVSSFFINVTNFFRDPQAFEVLQSKVIPAIFSKKKADEQVKVWVAACSSGEEAYSLAMLFHEYMERRKIPDQTVKIFATDIDAEALEVASRGLYSASAVSELGLQRSRKYFIKEGKQYRIAPALRKMVIFAAHDLLNDPPFSRMDLITCRNMLIYVEGQLQSRVLKKFQFALNVDGYLMLGPSEHIGILRDVTEEVSRKWKVYKCFSRANLFEQDAPLSLPMNSALYLPRKTGANPAAPRNALQHLPDILRDTLLDTRKLAGIFVDKDFNVKQAIGAFKYFLEFPTESFNLSLLKLVSPELAVPIGLCLRKAMIQNEKVSMTHVRLRNETAPDSPLRDIHISVKPWLQQQEYAQSFLFVVLEEVEFSVAAPLFNRTEAADFDTSELTQIEVLEKELRESRENLQAVIEQMETANEELQASNEEMVSTNEELQSTNEELQSLNEELRTVSAEYQLKIKELYELNDDLNNYFRNSDIGQILVDRNLLVRKFSPAVTRLVNLIDSDLGRPIADITNNIFGANFLQEVQEVMRSGKATETEINLVGGGTFLMRIAPYERRDRSIDGVVINFVDITESKRLSGIIEAVFNSSPNGIAALKAIRNQKGKIIDYEYLAVNTAAAEAMDNTPEAILGQRVFQLFPDITQEMRKVYEDVVETGRIAPFVHFEAKSGKWFGFVAVKMLDGLVITFTDITEQRLANDIIARNYAELQSTSRQLEDTNVQLERSNFDLQQFASVASHDLKEPLRKIQMFSGILQTRLQSRLNEEEQTFFAKIISASERMQSLIADVLSFSKLSNQDLPFEPVDLNAVMAQIEEDLEITVRERKATLDFGPLPAVEAVPGQMRQLFQNMVSNALKFNDKPHPHIRIKAADVSAGKAKALGLPPTANYVCITVADNGIGFESQFSEKIFGLFQRLEGRAYEGTGIGLAIAKRIVEGHGGLILAEGKPEKGAEFSIYLPKEAPLSPGNNHGTKTDQQFSSASR